MKKRLRVEVCCLFEAKGYGKVVQQIRDFTLGTLSSRVV